MKKLFSLLAIALTISFSSCTEASAQSTTPRYGVNKSKSATFSNLSFDYKAYTDAASIDTIKLLPSAYQNEYVVNLTDTVVMSIRSVSQAFRGDRMRITFVNSSGANHYVRFLGYASVYSGATKWGMSSTGTAITLASAKNAILDFYFDGTLWSEVSRAIQ